MSKNEHNRENDDFVDAYYEDREDHIDNSDDDGWHPEVIQVLPTPVVAVVPSIPIVNNVVNVVVNTPRVEVNNAVTVINEQVETVISPSVPTPPKTNYIYGTNKKDYLSGTDQDDVIYGYQGNDTLIDGTGADKLYGAKGKNIYQCTADGQVDFVYVKKDKQPDIVRFIGLEDRIDLPGSKFKFYAVDQGIGIFLKNQLQAVYTGNNLSISQLQSVTV